MLQQGPRRMEKKLKRRIKVKRTIKELKEEKRLLENKFYKALVDFENKFDAKVNYINIKRHQAMGCDDEIIAIHMEVNV